MGRRRLSSGGLEALGIAVLAVFALLASIPKEVWIAAGVFGIAWLAYHFYAQFKKADAPVAGVAEETTRAPAAPTSFRPATIPEPSAPSPVSSSSFRVPEAPKGYGAGVWIPRGQAVEVSGATLPGGMLYVGTSLKTRYGENDPCLIDPSMPVASHGDFTEHQTDYWPSYSSIKPSARRGYLNWLAEGRSHPEADIGYVFLFFYGLERRAIIDGSQDPLAAKDRPAIAEELRRLLGIYGEKSHSFRRYATALLDWVELARQPSKLYENPIPDFLRSYELPLYVRLALGQASVDGAQVPAHLALAWARLDPNIALRTPATRCREQFDKLFKHKYAEAFGAGMVLPRNRTKLKFVYRPASAGFRSYNEIKLTFGEIPDVTVLTAPPKKLQQVIDAATEELEPYSRHLGRNPGAKGSLEGLVHLPATLWPEGAQKAVEGLKSRMEDGMTVLPFQELLSALGASTAPTKDRVLALARALESMNIAMEPDVLSGAKPPKGEERIVLFAVPPAEPMSRSTPTYQAALLTLQLASSVAAADGEFGIDEMSHLREQVQSWTHLAPNHQRRLRAHLQLLETSPVSLTTLRKKLDPLEAAAKEKIATFMATVAQADGTVTPAEVKMLEKVYKVLCVEPKRLFSDIHAAAAGGAAPSAAAQVKREGFRLDEARIAELQRDTDKVSVLLAGIFEEEEEAQVPAAAPELDEAEESTPSGGLLGLDEAHTAFARLLLSRPEWSREELLDVSADLDLMLDGALEHINEASFDHLDVAFTEGDDPVEVNAEVLEKIES